MIDDTQTALKMSAMSISIDPESIPLDYEYLPFLSITSPSIVKVALSERVRMTQEQRSLLPLLDCMHINQRLIAISLNVKPKHITCEHDCMSNALMHDANRCTLLLWQAANKHSNGRQAE